MSKTNLSRRHFSALLAASAGGVLLPRPMRAGRVTGERKFLFVFCRGGWDTTYVFTPLLDHPSIVPPPGDELLEAAGVPFVHNDTRPSVATFFEAYASQACIINGLEIRSVTHERCRQLVMTGTASGGDDWPSVLAHHSAHERLVPHIVVAGPAFTAQYTGSVVRVGDSGQLPSLLSGEAILTAEKSVLLPPDGVASLTDAFLADRLASRADATDRSQRSRYLSQYAEALQRADLLAPYAEQIDSNSKPGCRRDNAADASIIFDLFELGLARCGMIEDNGYCSAGWDTHEGNAMQDWHYEELFASLSEIMADLNSRPGEYSDRLADEVTVVVFSEMGRHPLLNARGGKEHWTYTSAMLLGAGVAGGQVIGGLDDDGLGLPIDLASGESTSTGTALTGGNLGATLMAMGGLDPAEFIGEVQPIEAAMG